MKSTPDIISESAHDRDASTILIVENSPAEAEQLRQLLERHHFKATVTYGGMQALRVLADGKDRKTWRVPVGADIKAGGEKRFINIYQEQMLSLLITSFESSIRQYADMGKIHKETGDLNERLEKRVKERTLWLINEIKVRLVAEKELRISEERYRNLFDNANDMIYTHDLERNFTSMNRAALKATGYSLEEVLRMNVDSIVAPEFESIFEEKDPSRTHPVREGAG